MNDVDQAIGWLTGTEELALYKMERCNLCWSDWRNAIVSFHRESNTFRGLVAKYGWGECLTLDSHKSISEGRRNSTVQTLQPLKGEKCNWLWATIVAANLDSSVKPVLVTSPDAEADAESAVEAPTIGVSRPSPERSRKTSSVGQADDLQRIFRFSLNILICSPRAGAKSGHSTVSILEQCRSHDRLEALISTRRRSPNVWLGVLFTLVVNDCGSRRPD
jgi:hypothetical protein